MDKGCLMFIQFDNEKLDVFYFSEFSVTLQGIERDLRHVHNQFFNDDAVFFNFEL